MEKSIALQIGEGYHLKTGKDRITYAGMPNENVYSIVQRKAYGYQGYAWNLFFPKRKQDIVIDRVRVFVDTVDPEEIRFRVA